MKLEKQCPYCNFYNEEEDNPNLTYCPFCKTKLVSNYDIVVIMDIEGGKHELRIPKSLSKKIDKSRVITPW